MLRGSGFLRRGAGGGGGDARTTTNDDMDDMDDFAPLSRRGGSKSEATKKKHTQGSSDIINESKKGIGGEGQQEQQQQSHQQLDQISLTSSDVDSVDSVVVLEESTYTLGDHAEYLSIKRDIGGHDYCDMGHLLVESRVPKLVRDFCSPLPYERINALYYGLDTPPRRDEPEALPVRTLTFRLRPDIMSGVVLDAVQEACEGCQENLIQILKKGPGSIVCLILPQAEMGSAPPFMVDAHICTSRSGEMERELLLRIFHALEVGSNDGTTKKGKGGKSKSEASTQRPEDHFGLDENQDLLIPFNLHLKDACAFLQHVDEQKKKLTKQFKQNQKQQQQKTRGSSSSFRGLTGATTTTPHIVDNTNAYELSSPRETPKASTAFFAGNYEPTFSVQLVKELKTVHTALFPSLNTEDWSLIQYSWPTLSKVWRQLSIHNCVFHTIETIPLVDEEDGDAGPVLDLHYTTQIRQLSREGMLEEVRSSFNDLQGNLVDMEDSYANFLLMLRRTWKRFNIANYEETNKRSPKLMLPLQVCPPGYTILAAMACKYAQSDDDDPDNIAGLCDDAVRKVYKTFCSQDDHLARKHLKEANNAVMKRLVEIQKTQMTLVNELESHPNTQAAAREFCKLARKATNTKGRVERLILAKVPLLEFEIIGGKCQITSSAMLCVTEGVFGTKYNYFDLKAIQLEIRNETCLAVMTRETTTTTTTTRTAMSTTNTEASTTIMDDDDNDKNENNNNGNTGTNGTVNVNVNIIKKEQIFKLNTATNLNKLIKFVSTLSTLQGVFTLHTTGIPDETALQDMVSD